MQNELNYLKRKIVEVSHEAETSHIGSALSNIDIIDAVYQIKAKNEKFVLSNGHAAAALYVVLEKNGYVQNPRINELGVHPERNPGIDIEVSTGSLGQGLPIAVGIALADRSKRTFCSVSDGECAEGSVWEAVRVASKYHLNNLIIIVNANGYAGYEEVDPEFLVPIFQAFGCDVIDVDGHNVTELKEAMTIETDGPLVVFARTRVDHLPFLSGLDAHYYKTKHEDIIAMETIWSKN